MHRKLVTNPKKGVLKLYRKRMLCRIRILPSASREFYISMTRRGVFLYNRQMIPKYHENQSVKCIHQLMSGYHLFTRDFSVKAGHCDAKCLQCRQRVPEVHRKCIVANSAELHHNVFRWKWCSLKLQLREISAACVSSSAYCIPGLTWSAASALLCPNTPAFHSTRGTLVLIQ